MPGLPMYSPRQVIRRFLPRGKVADVMTAEAAKDEPEHKHGGGDLCGMMQSATADQAQNDRKVVESRMPRVTGHSF
jgi:hypothetical protein